jgi:alpha-L-glutamate ligase-like protein
MPLTDLIFLHYPLGINRRNHIIREMNSIFSIGLAKNKARFKQLLDEHGIAVPRTFHEISDFSGFGHADFFPDEFVLKPNQGMGGNGILILKREEETFVTPSGEKYSAGHLRRHVRKILDGEFSGHMEKDTVLIEERIYSSASLQFKGAVGLPDIRVFCYQFEPVMGMFRYATAESRGRANLTQGAIGMGIDLTGGTITHIHSKKEKRPLTAEEFGIPPSFTIPKWEEIKAIAQEAARLSQLQVAGVDIILDARDTVMVLEINGHPGLEIQNVNERSLWQSMRHS